MNILIGIFRFVAILLLMLLSFSCIPLMAYTMGLLIKDLGILYGVLPAVIAGFGVAIVMIIFAAIAGDLMAGKTVVDTIKRYDIIKGD